MDEPTTLSDEEIHTGATGEYRAEVSDADMDDADDTDDTDSTDATDADADDMDS
jgi:hypothetical protein